jgi:hypothetical protein
MKEDSKVEEFINLYKTPGYKWQALGVFVQLSADEVVEVMFDPRLDSINLSDFRKDVQEYKASLEAAKLVTMNAGKLYADIYQNQAIKDLGSKTPVVAFISGRIIPLNGVAVAHVKYVPRSRTFTEVTSDTEGAIQVLALTSKESPFH